MLRKLAFIAAATSALWLSVAAGLGLGDIDVRSKLNQKFSASIPLTALGADEVEGLIVNLGSNDDFRKAGLDRSEFVSTLEFEVRTDGGQPRIEVSSRALAREPYVSFLVEVRGVRNRLLREYTVLLDPADLPMAKAAPAPGPSSQFYETPSDTSSKPAAPQVDVPPPPPLAAVPPPPAPDAAPDTAAAAMPGLPSGDYGPVQVRDTLWSIANKMRTDPAVSIDQMLLAVYTTNPKAFDGGINNLRKGVMLHVPTLEEQRAVSASAAKARVAELRGMPAPARAPAPLKITPPTVGVPATTPAPPPAVAPAPAPKPEIKSAPKPEVKAEPPKPQAAPTPPPAAVTPPTPPPAAVVPPPAPAPEQVATTPPPAAETPPPAEAAAPAEEPASTSSTPPIPPVPMEEPDDEEGMPLGLIFAVLLLLVAGGAGGFWFYRKRQQGSADSSSPDDVQVASAAPADDDPTPLLMAKTSSTSTQPRSVMDELEKLESSLEQDPVDLGATAITPRPVMDSTLTMTAQMPAAQQFVDPNATAVMEASAAATARLTEKVDFDVTGQFESDTVSINLDTNDPVAEADFHLAYGLYDEAALLLIQAAEKDPANTAVSVKLAEVYFAAGKPAEFQSTAESLKGRIEASEWQKLAILGQQLCPDAAIFQDIGAGDLGGAVDLSFDEPAAAETPVLDLPEMTLAPAAPSGGGSSLDFKLDDLQLPASEPEPAAAATLVPGSSNSLEFSLDVPEIKAEPVKDNGLEFDLASFDLAVPAAAPAPAAAAPALSAGNGELHLEDFDVSADSASLSTGDTAGTKLDLARAYMDMDKDMAKTLLEEVVQQGNAEQKKEAQDLMSRI